MAKTENAEAIKQAAPPQQTYKLEKLRKSCGKLFGVSSATFAGATSKLDPKGEYTVDDIKNTITTWLKKEAK